MVTSRTPSPTFVPARPLALAERDDPRGSPLSGPHPLAPIALILTCLTLLLTHFASFWAGRMVEQRTQLGYLIAAAPTLDDMRAATRSADSLAMRFMLQMGRMRKTRAR